MKRKRTAAAVLLISITAMLTAVNPPGIEGDELLYVQRTPPVNAEDALLGRNSTLEELPYGEDMINAIKVLFLNIAVAEDDDSGSFLAPETDTMFRVLFADTLIPMLPADYCLTGSVSTQNDIVLLPVKLVFGDRELPGELYFTEEEGRWKILSADFDFSYGND